MTGIKLLISYNIKFQSLEPAVSSNLFVFKWLSMERNGVYGGKRNETNDEGTKVEKKDSGSEGASSEKLDYMVTLFSWME